MRIYGDRLGYFPHLIGHIRDRKAEEPVVEIVSQYYCKASIRSKVSDFIDILAFNDSDRLLFVS
jgi:hypothetical protein